MKTHRIALAGLAAAAFCPTGPALAHATLVASTPANGAVVAAPKAITLTFNEKIVPAFSQISLTMPVHKMNVPVKVTFGLDGKTASAIPQGNLPQGAYAVEYAVASSDGHRMTGTVPFTVR